MSKLVQRLLIFILGVPAVAALVLLLPWHSHLALNLVVVAFAAGAAAEFSVMLSRRNMAIPKAEAAVLGALLPAAAVAAVMFGLDSAALVAAAATLGVSWLLLSRVFSRGEKLDNFAASVAAGVSAMLYPGLFLTWLLAMTGWDNSGVVIITFLVAVFGGDSLAWATGMLFGKNNRGVVPASPNKSLAGFAGGVLGPVIVGTSAALLLPAVFVPATPLPAAAAGAVLGLLTGCAAILGDLAESAFKRSTGIKDSGSVIMGRGGVLDSLDSVAFAAPVFYLCFRMLFG